MKTIISFIFAFVYTLSFCQSDTCLTTDFSKLKPKKRIEVGKRELKEAESDTIFKDLMVHGDSLFKLSLYKESLVVFLEARRRRPYNVYPKIKIQDLNNLLKESENKGKNVPVIKIDSLKSESSHQDLLDFSEKTFYEGNSFVIEREVPVGDSLNVYRRVISPHNTYYFLNGVSVDPRVWNYRFKK